MIMLILTTIKVNSKKKKKLHLVSRLVGIEELYTYIDHIFCN